MKLTFIIENHCKRAKLKAEHGLAVLIETNENRILFDTGASPLIIHNAAALNIPLTHLDALILSHSHYDHTGGAEEIINLNPGIPIYTGAGFFHSKFNTAGQTKGALIDQRKCINHIEINQITEILPEITIFPAAPIVNKKDTHFQNMVRSETKDGKRVNDDFREEIFLTIGFQNRYLLLNGCAHRGISNAYKMAEEAHTKLPDVITGGFHLVNSKQEEIEELCSWFEQQGKIPRCYCSHCTGLEAYAVMKNRWGEKVSYCSAGSTIKF